MFLVIERPRRRDDRFTKASFMVVDAPTKAAALRKFNSNGRQDGRPSGHLKPEVLPFQIGMEYTL